MIKYYEAFRSLAESGLKIGDKVMVKYKESKYFMKYGRITYIKNSGKIQGDCTVKFDYDGIIESFYYTNLLKVIEIIEVPTGEVFNIDYEDASELDMTGIIRYNPNTKYYYFDEQDRWQIDQFIL